MQASSTISALPDQDSVSVPLAIVEQRENAAQPQKSKTSQPQTERPAKTDAPTQPKMSVVVVHDAATLAPYVPAWEKLSDAALEPNAFYEPWMLLPAIESFSAGHDLHFVLIFSSAPNNSSDATTLCGFFPFERKQRYKGLPIKVFSLWEHLYCFLCTPLIHKDYARETLDALFNWLGALPDGPALLELNSIHGEGDFYHALVEHLHFNARLSFVEECSTRALCRPKEDSQTYMTAALSRKRRKELQRLSNRLSELGQVEYKLLGPEALLDNSDSQDMNATIWIEEFLKLEAGGWKGREQTAFASREVDREFFKKIAISAFQHNKLMMLSLRLNGQPVAHKFNLLAGNGSFAFKIAYDEDFARFSPGVLLELENIRRLHAIPHIHWMDSCAIPSHFMINRLWTERRVIQTILVATGRPPGEFVVSFLPMLRWFNRKLRRTGKTHREGQQTVNEDIA